MLDTDSEYPRYPAAGGAEDRVALAVDLEREGVHERDRQPGAHDRRPLVPEAVHTLQLALGADSAEPRQHHLLPAYSEQTLLVYETPAVAGLLDPHLQLDDSADAGPAGTRRPVVAGGSIAHRRLSVGRDGARHVAEVRRSVEVVLVQGSAEAGAELLLVTAEGAT